MTQGRTIILWGLLSTFYVTGSFASPTNTYNVESSTKSISSPDWNVVHGPSVLLRRADGSNYYTNWPTQSGSSYTSWPSDSSWAGVPEWPAAWGTRPSNYKTVRIVHAVLAASAFLIFFPVGGIIMRVSRHPNAIWIHAAVQTFGYVVFVTAAGLGIWMAKKVHALDDYHPMIGLVLLCFISLQPLSSLVNHFYRVRYPRIGILGQVHLWSGRLLITLGIINGGLGFQFASTLPVFQWPKGPKILYGAVATLIWIIYVGVVLVWAELKRTPNTSAGDREQLTPAIDGRGRNVADRPSTAVTAEDADSNILSLPGPEKDNPGAAHDHVRTSTV
ncbi:hypothetical protein PV05_09123 [Exophiala xenobiotica]|uniref:Cytochrome b561 domain-containing protein n=1 Tax=Exophiala xenobiotica TaxID=348802 RepID=A0A0D2EDX8_9EURO|nr:uncharacterized protein PV05_09123 [Exophiala xenobiotica]KIW53563.1 hypothetical protein PV05_09123 [Exophiala xenobiotica]